MGVQTAKEEPRRPKRVRIIKPVVTTDGPDLAVDDERYVDEVRMSGVTVAFDADDDGILGAETVLLDVAEYEVIEWHDSETPAETETA
jgi:hypothetical protein